MSNDYNLFLAGYWIGDAELAFVDLGRYGGVGVKIIVCQWITQWNRSVVAGKKIIQPEDKGMWPGKEKEAEGRQKPSKIYSTKAEPKPNRENS